MDWRRWHRASKIAVVLITATMLIWLSSLAGASPGTETRRPDAAGDETSLTPNTGANWASVDEATSDDDITYVEGGGGGYATDLYNLPDVTVLTSRGKINSVTVYIHARGTKAGIGARTRIKTNTVAYDGAEIALTTAYATYSTAYTTNPQTTNEWTWAEVNALQAGEGLKKPAGGNTARCTQVWVVVDYTPATLESYKELAHTTIWGTVVPNNPYDDTTQTAYIYGSNFIASHSYTVGYYDGSGAKTASESVTSATDNTLSSLYLLSFVTSAIAGTWHAVVFDNDLGSPSATYAAAPSSPGYMVEDAFVVTDAAIPEFPTVMAGIMVAALSFLIYYWMRKRRLGDVRVKA